VTDSIRDDPVALRAPAYATKQVEEDRHDAEYLKYFVQVCRNVGEGMPVYPYVFPIRNRARPPVELPARAGYYCIDTFTPISSHADTADF